MLANRIALLKQEEMKTWKMIETTKKKTTDLQVSKKRNEEKVQKVHIFVTYLLFRKLWTFKSTLRSKNKNLKQTM